MDAAFAIVRTCQPIGFGQLIVDSYRDGEIVAQKLASAGIVRQLRPGQGHALRALLERPQAIVSHEWLVGRGGSRDTLRRDLGDLRPTLETLGLELEVQRGVGYRLRPIGAGQGVRLALGDARFDVDVRELSNGSNSVRLGRITTALLLALADGKPREADELYRMAWHGVPHDVARVVCSRISALRGALRAVRSKAEIRTATVLGSRARYYLYFGKTPKGTSICAPSSRATSEFQIVIGL